MTTVECGCATGVAYPVTNTCRKRQVPDALNRCNRTCALQLFKFGSSWPVAGAQRCLSKWFTEKRHFLKGTARTARFKVWDMLDMLPEAFQR